MSSISECAALVNLVINFIIGEEVDDREGEPVRGKKARLEQDSEQLFGPHYHSGRRAGHQCTAEEEFCDYLQTPQIPTMQNVLQWWAENEDRFPHLAKLGKRYLAVPATSTPSERIFSLAGNTITRQRASLRPAHVDALVFLHANQDRKTGAVSEQDFDGDE